jgi:hypothetical protein
MRRVASLFTGGLLPFLVSATLLLPGCPLTDGYYIANDDPNAAGGPDTSLSGRGGTSSAGGATNAGGKSGAGGKAGPGGKAGAPGAVGASGSVGTSGADGANTPDAEGCVSLTNQGHVYAFCFTPLIQAEARAICANRGMTLAVMEDRAESDWIAQTFSGQHQDASTRAFIGANDATNEGEWKWADGNVFWRGGAAISGRYTNWSDGEPNDESPIDGAADCLTIYFADGTWADLSCDAELPYVCEPR